MNKTKYINSQKITFFPSRLVFFADAKKEKEKSWLQEREKDLHELESLPGTPLAKEVAAKFRKGKIDSKIFDEIRDILKDPNRMERKEYQYFMKALAKGRFPKRAKNALHFLEALKGSEKEKKYAADVLDHLSREDAQDLSEYKEKTHLKKLTDIRASEAAEETSMQTGVKAAAITETAEIGSLLKASAETSGKNWEVEGAPREVIERLDNLELKQYELMKKANAKRDEHEKALSSEKRDEALIEKLDREIADIDKEIDTLRLEANEVKVEYRQYLLRNAARFEALEKFFKRAGVNINTAKRLKMWFFDLTHKGMEDSRTSLKIKGLVIDPQTGEAKKEEGYIEILGIRFVKDRSDLAPESPGELLIQYKNEKGEETECGYRYFIQLIDAFEGYEEIASLKEVNQKIEEETRYIDIAVGQEFETEIVTELDEEGNEKREKLRFKIENIDEKKQTITLDHSVTKTPRQWLSASVSPYLYFDRKQRTFSFGEFVKFIKQHGYTREVKADEMQRSMNGQYAARTRECNEMLAGATPTERKKFAAIGGYPQRNLTLPESGGENKVFFLDENGRRREGRLTREIGEEREEGFYLEKEPLAATGTDGANGPNFEQYAAAGIPLSIAAAGPARIDAIPRKGGKWTKRKLTSPSQYQLVDKAEVSGADRTHIPVGGAAGEMGIASSEEISGKKKYYEEALPYEDVFKYGGMSWKTEGLVKSMWVKTRFVSMNDFWELGKSMWEYYVRRWERRQKEKYSSIAKEIPFWAPEMKRVHQAAENEQVNQFKESFEQMGIFDIEKILRTTGNRDAMKAAFTVLSEKGELRFDDIEMWKNLNKFVRPELAVPIPSSGDPRTQISEDDERTGIDFLKDAIDSLWGDGQYNEWFHHNKSSFQSKAQEYFEEGKELEGVEGGHARRLGVLLRMHKEGKFVDPHEYEGLILHAIKAGKSRMQSKLYYMIEGVAAVNHHGHTILSFDRMAHFNSEMLGNFPLLEYLCASVPRPPEGKSSRFTIDDYKKWVHWFDNGDPMNPARHKPGVAVDEFLWKYVIPSDETQNRINKALRHGENLDHDDMFAYLPPATEQVITDACQATTGSKKFLTIEGYANVIPGFSQYMRSLAGNNNRDKLKEAVKSYIRYEGIMTNRYEKGDKRYQRLDYATLNSATIVTDTPPQAFIDAMNKTMREIINAYDDQELTRLGELIYDHVEDVTTREGQERQNKINLAFEKFGEVFNRVVKSDNGTKMTAIISAANFEGMKWGLSEAEFYNRKSTYSDKMALEY